MPTNDERAASSQPPDPQLGDVTITVTLTPMLQVFYARDAAQSGMTIEEVVQRGVDCYADAMSSQWREDDAFYDELGVPQENRVY